MQSKDLAYSCAKLLSDRKAIDIRIIDIGEKSSFADYIVIAEGNSDRQVNALCDDIEERLAKDDILPRSIEGRPDSGWILMDYRDVIVNIFAKEMREKYNLESIWGDCPAVSYDTQTGEEK